MEARAWRQAGDFQTYELIAIVERFATGFDELPEFVPGRPVYRVLITTGTLFAAFMVVGQVMADGTIELLQLEIDLDPPPRRGIAKGSYTSRVSKSCSAVSNFSKIPSSIGLTLH